jgi:DNA-binding LacI/PurR family transcriptional regulator
MSIDTRQLRPVRHALAAGHTAAVGSVLRNFRGDDGSMASSADVAARAGVSRSTVSQILNGYDFRFTPETVARVRDAADGLRYRPSLAGRTLARGHSDVVITLVPDIVFGPRLREYVDRLSAELAEAGLTHLLQLASSGEWLLDAVAGLRPRAVVSLLGDLTPAQRARFESYAVQVIGQPAGVLDALDTAIGAAQAQHLVEAGYRAVATVHPAEAPQYAGVRARAAGAREWCARNNVEVVGAVTAEISHDGGARVVAQLSGNDIGVACYNDELALVVTGAAHRAGIKVPGQLGVVGVDDSTLASLATPTLSTVGIDLSFSSHETVRLILDGPGAHLAGDSIDRLIHQVRVVPGESTRRPH